MPGGLEIITLERCVASAHDVLEGQLVIREEVSPWSRPGAMKNTRRVMDDFTALNS